MKFKDWFDSKLEPKDYTEKDIEDLCLSWSRINLDVLKKIYNAYKHTGLLDLDEVYIFKNSNLPKDYYYLAINDKVMNIEDIFSFTRQMVGNDILTKLDKEEFKKFFLFIYDKDTTYNDKDKYFFLLSLNPNEYTTEYIETIEDLLNENITLHNTVNGVIDEVIDLVKSNNYIKNVILSIWRDFAIMGFKSQVELTNYIKNRTLLEQDNIIKVESEEELKELLRSLSNSNSNNNNGNNTLLN